MLATPIELSVDVDFGGAAAAEDKDYVRGPQSTYSVDYVEDSSDSGPNLDVIRFKVVPPKGDSNSFGRVRSSQKLSKAVEVTLKDSTTRIETAIGEINLSIPVGAPAGTLGLVCGTLVEILKSQSIQEAVNVQVAV